MVFDPTEATSVVQPQSFVIGEECQKAAWQNGFRRPLGEAGGWARYGSTTASGTIWIAASNQDGPWFLAIDHAGIVDELQQAPANMPGPGIARYVYPSLDRLYASLARIYQLGVTLPDGPLEEFRDQVQNLPKTTEAERLVIQRVGQDIFRSRLMIYWQGRCPLTGITDLALLRASHIISWKDCTSDAERLDVHNGLLLSALWDAAFDRGLVTFDDDGRPEFSQTLTDAARAELRWHAPIPLNDKHRHRLVWHRARVFGSSYNEEAPL